MSQHELFGYDLLGHPVRQLGGPLAQKFIWPPFTVLNSQTGAWQERKRAWLALGIQSELGRGAYLMDDSKSSVYNGRSDWSGDRGGRRAQSGNLTWGRGVERTDDASRRILASGRKLAPGGSPRPATDYSHNERGDGRGRPLRDGDFVGTHDGSEAASIRLGIGRGGHSAPLQSHTSSSDNAMTDAGGFENSAAGTSGTSVFDPVLCELAYRWFCPAGGLVLDPFAGGSVRGIVASALGLSYVGMDLSRPQLEANRLQAQTICPSWPMPLWVQGDSRTLDSDLLGGPFDFVFSCPPYGDLEVYSDDPRDVSTMPYRLFLGAMQEILERCVDGLARDRFLAVVVGDFRDEDGWLRGFPGDLIDRALRAGLSYYNDAILVTAIGSLPIRVAFAWERGRKLGRTHQHLLVFAKGDARRAAAVVTDTWGPAASDDATAETTEP